MPPRTAKRWQNIAWGTAKRGGLSLAAQDGVPAVAGLAGADVEFELTQAGGRAALAMAGGRLLLPGVFEDPVVPVQQLSATVRWQGVTSMTTASSASSR